jgi:hypothetical protein
MVHYLMFHWAVKDDAIRHEGIDSKTVQQATIRLLLPPGFSLLGIVISPFSPSLSFVLFAFPIVFNIIPGTLNATEYLFGKIFSFKGPDL